MFPLYAEKRPLILIYLCFPQNLCQLVIKKIQKNANDLFYKTLIIGVIVLTCKKSKLSLLASVNCSCLLRLFSPQNWVLHKSLVSTILL